ncbi:prepilin peptidase [Paenibacillus allorhizosphaerae]|uniref:Prepilin type IV endopeptidase peptidase domain-containing protein n=1 Tax=Paenibacillus allorhizosphaerae TaxID=2849866 RepID=A0ABM8VE94_9BACL|nr:A24 family peptidase [Paenibacillus allorhizosphaerae]CAG7630011.1 hypothetical protein PAECIP111802_01610 [Paenibacillus allorhizosphaerae]
MIAYWLAAALLLIAFVTDTRRQKIPNLLNLTGVVAGLALHTITNGWEGFVFAAVGLICGLLPMLALYAIGAVGAGDVKFFAALGAITGAGFSIYAMTASLLLAGAGGLAFLLCRTEGLLRLKAVALRLLQLFVFRDTTALRTALAKSESQLRFPFMWAVLPGTACAFMQLYAQ